MSQTRGGFYRSLPASIPRLGFRVNKVKAILGGSWDLVIRNYKYSYLNYNPSY